MDRQTRLKVLGVDNLEELANDREEWRLCDAVMELNDL